MLKEAKELKRRFFVFIAVSIIAILVIAGCADQNQVVPSPTVTPVPSPTATLAPSPTPSPMDIVPDMTPNVSPSPTVSPQASP